MLLGTKGFVIYLDSLILEATRVMVPAPGTCASQLSACTAGSLLFAEIALDLLVIFQSPHDG